MQCIIMEKNTLIKLLHHDETKKRAHDSQICLMFGAIPKATISSFQKGMAFCLSIYIKKVMKLLAFIFEHGYDVRYPCL